MSAPWVTWRRLFRLRATDLLLALGLIYPFLVYFGLSRFEPAVFAVLIVLMALPRLPAALRRPVLALPVVGLCAYALLLAVTNSPLLVRLYPAVINLALLCAFGASIKFPPPMIERIAAAAGDPVSAEGKTYVYRLTLIWCAFFAVNAALALYTAMATSLATWTLYNGLISYLLIGALIGGELLYRRHYMARVHKPANEPANKPANKPARSDS